MGKHLSLVTVESDATTVTVSIRCDACEGGTFRIATAHLETLARVLPGICAQAGIDLEDGVTETHVFDLAEPEARVKADAFYQDFVRRRKAQP